ncbi:hypothetical protein N0V88_007445 [Collariella sp. IMI 366227]|nr:hypothetical protein N0V88_007445 [Collariella sp. IMI 366227]
MKNNKPTTTPSQAQPTPPLTTPYYTASIPIWLDLISTPTDWSATFLSPEAKEVLDVLGVLVLEALQANDWSGGGIGEGDDDGGGRGKRKKGKEKMGGEEEGEFDPENLEFGFDREDFAGLKKAIWGGGDGQEEGENEEVGEEDIQKLERMMVKLQAVRDATAGLPEEQRKKMAARAVGEVMKEL